MGDTKRHWELHDGDRQTPPLDEDHVLRMIDAGLPPSTLARQAGTEHWVNLRTHAPFAMALERKAAVPAPVMASAPPPVATPVYLSPDTVINVQTTQGATGKFLDPASNARSCLGCVAVFVVLGALLFLFGLMRAI